MSRTLFILAIFALASTAVADEPKMLVEARRTYGSLQHPSEKQRVAYVTKLVRLRETFTRRDEEALDAIDAEIVRHPMPASAATRALAKHLVGRWQSPRHSYFYRADGTWVLSEGIPGATGGTWHIESNQFYERFHDNLSEPGLTIILLTGTDFIRGTDVPHPYYLRRGKAFPWR